MLHRVCVAAAFAVFLGSCSHPDGRPSVLLFVFDTTRADAVSAYGRVRGTTPELDALAASGLRYTHAYANASWTLPSHATLFTGLLVHQHGVGSRGVRASDALVTLAQRLQAVGYETVGFSENPWVSETFNLVRGFEHFVSRSGNQTVADGQKPEPGQYNLLELVAAWRHNRKGHRPFFLFVNVMDAHELYAVRAENPFVPDGVAADAVRAVDLHVQERICAGLPQPNEIAILKGLYLGGVLAADAKLQAVQAVLRDGGLAEHLITIVTADHGEHFGEHRLMAHNFSVRDALLHVPLVVKGLAGAKPAVIEQPVQLADIAPTVLRWTQTEVPEDLPGRPLPTEPGPLLAQGSIVAEYTEADEVTESGAEPGWFKEARAQAQVMRSACVAEDRVFGNMLALVRYPFKLVWFERYPTELYDLASDPDERSDLATSRPDLVAVLRSDLDAALARAGSEVTPAPLATLPPDVREQLRVLGYAGGPAAGRATPTAPAH